MKLLMRFLLSDHNDFFAEDKWSLPAEALGDLSLTIQRKQKWCIAVAAKALEKFFCCLKTFKSAAISLWNHRNGVKNEVLQAGC